MEFCAHNNYQPFITQYFGIDLNIAWPLWLAITISLELFLCFFLARPNKALLEKLGYRGKHGTPIYTRRTLYKHFWQQRWYWFFDFYISVFGYTVAILVLALKLDYAYIDLIFALCVIIAFLRIWAGVSLIIRMGNAFCKSTGYIVGMILLPTVFYTRLALSDQVPVFISNYDE